MAWWSKDIQLDSAEARRRMVEEQLRRRDIVDPSVLEAMGRVAREEFVPEEVRYRAYDDRPLSIGWGQTISQPYIVALMTELIRPGSQRRVLEIGVGSGYQTAILAEICGEVFGIEIVGPLAEAARTRLAGLGYQNVTIRSGDGYRGWPEHAPFDAILIAAAPDRLPEPLFEQLGVGGRLALPVGRESQELVLIEKQPDGSFTRTNVTAVQFVPMTGEAAGSVENGE